MARLSIRPLRRLLHAPLLHFVLLGAVAFLVQRALDSTAPEVETIVIDAREIASLRRDHASQTGSEPSEETLRALIETRIDEAILLADARQLGWHRSDAIVQRRLIANQRFLAPDEEVDDAELLERAHAQGMAETDIVVRRRLIERMRLAIEASARETEPTEDALEAHLAAHRESFELPARVRLSHIYLSRDLRGAALPDDAREMGARLAETPLPPERALEWSDPFLMPSDLPLWSRTTLAARLGPEFAEAAFDLPLGRWSGPIPSSYGLHFVWPHERIAARLPAVDEVRRGVTASLQRERGRAALRRYLDRARERFEIRIDD